MHCQRLNLASRSALLLLLLLLLLLVDVGGDMAAMVWKVQRRNSQGRLGIAKPTTWARAADVPADCSFASACLR